MAVLQWAMLMVHGAVESDIAETRMEEKQNQNTVNGLSTLSERLDKVEADTKGAFVTRSFLVDLLLDFMTIAAKERRMAPWDRPFWTSPGTSTRRRGIAVPIRSSTCRTARDRRETMRVEAGGGRLVGSVS